MAPVSRSLHRRFSRGDLPIGWIFNRSGRRQFESSRRVLGTILVAAREFGLSQNNPLRARGVEDGWSVSRH